jgi:hypothetical protein
MHRNKKGMKNFIPKYKNYGIICSSNNGEGMLENGDKTERPC